MTPVRTMTFFLAVSAATIALAACSSDESTQVAQAAPSSESAADDAATEPEPVAPDAALAELVRDVFAEHSPQLARVSDIDQNPISPDFVLAQSRRALDALEPMLEKLPADISSEDAVSAAYAALRADLEGWQEHAASVIAEVEADYDALVALAEGWDGDSAPPPIFVDAIDGHLITWIPAVEQSCSAFAVETGVAAGCQGFGLDGGPGETRAAGPQTANLAGIDLVIDPLYPVTDLGVAPEHVFIDYGPGVGTLTLVASPAVTSPPTAGPVLDATLAWPADVDEWLAELPVDVVSKREVQLGSVDWRVWNVRSDEHLALIENLLSPEGAWLLGDAELHVYETIVADTALVAVLDVAPPDLERTDEIVADIDAVLETLEVS